MNLSQKPLDDGIWLVEVDGRLDQDSTGEFEDQLKQALDLDRTRLLIDLAQVTYVNSGGLRCLVTIWRRARELDGDIALVNLNEHIDRIFTMVGFDKVFKIFDDLEEARGHMAGDR